MIIAFTIIYKENIYAQMTVYNPSTSLIDINNITSWIYADGFHDGFMISSLWNGMFPKGSNIGAIFSEGIILGGKVNDGQAPLARLSTGF